MAISNIHDYKSYIEVIPKDKNNLYVLHIDTGHLGNESSQKYIEKYKNIIDETKVLKDLDYIILQKNKNVESNIKMISQFEVPLQTVVFI